MKIRTRYAPSPTGFFHVGGLRTALYCYLYAEHYAKKGEDSKYVFRIEDTDQERHVEKGIYAQTQGQEWAGITPYFSDQSWWKEKVHQQKDNKGNDIGYRQSLKLEKFYTYAEELVKQGKAYYCFCSEEELEEARKEAEVEHRTPKYNRRCLHLTKEQIDEKIAKGIPHAIRLKIDENRIYKWNDLIRGEMEVPGDALTDPIIVRSNKMPMYNFSVVLDDYMMQITHIFRGEEHLSNTPYQIAIREALEPILLSEGWPEVKEVFYGHLSIVVGADGKKLSKRDKTLRQFIMGDSGDDYMTLGYYPDAIRNFVALLGWSPADNKEILSKDELIDRFDGSRINKAPAFFDIKKMDWISGEYFKTMSDEKYLEFVKPFVNVDLSFTGEKDLALLTFKKQIAYASQLNDLIKEYFIDINFDSVDKILETNGVSKENYEKCSSAFLGIAKEFGKITPENTKEIINKVKETTGLKGKDLFMPIRVCVIAKEHGPEMDKILPVMSKKILS